MEELTFQFELETLLNKHNQESASDTPDFLLAEYLIGCLAVWNQTVKKREAWYGRVREGIGGSGDAPIASDGVN